MPPAAHRPESAATAEPATGRPATPSPRPDLRERRRIRARVAVQEAALDLFAERGYARTTVEEIAAAAGISPATFYRYFPKKEDVVLYDHVDFEYTEAILDAPPEMTLVQAFRHAMRVAWSDRATAPERRRENQRLALALRIPEIRARMVDTTLGTLNLMVAAVAERAGLPADDPRPRAWAGMIFGAVLASFPELVEGNIDMDDFIARADAALDAVEEILTV